MLETLSRVKSHIFNKDNTGKLMLLGVMSVASIFVNIATPYIFGQAIQSLATNTVGEIFYIQMAPWVMVIFYGASILMGRLFPIGRKNVVTPIANNVQYSYIKEYMDRLTKLSYESELEMERICECGKNELLNKVMNNSGDFAKQLLEQVMPTTLETITAGALLSYRYGWPIGLSVLGVAGFTALYNSLTASCISNVEKDLLKLWGPYSRQTKSIMMHYENIHMFNNTAYELSKLDGVLKPLIDAQNRRTAVPNYLLIGQFIFIMIAFGAITSWYAQNVIAGTASIDDFVTVSYYLLQFSMPLGSFSDGLTKLIADMNILNVYETFLKLPQVSDPYQSTKLNVTRKTATVTFQNVTFGYKPGVPVLKDVSFNIAVGKKTGIVGATGAGKSTIARLLFRFFDIQKGKITINNQSIYEVSLESLRSEISIVPQNPVLFVDKISYNIWYGGISKRGEAIDSPVLQRAIEVAELEDFIKEKGRGVDFQIEERSANISGGQLQRIATARALLKKPSIIILDEATSALDSETEKKVQKNLDEAIDGITTIVITHRLFSLVNAHNIIVLDKGKVVEQDTHANLLAKNGKYARLWKKQAAPFVPHAAAPRVAVATATAAAPTLAVAHPLQETEEKSPSLKPKKVKSTNPFFSDKPADYKLPSKKIGTVQQDSEEEVKPLLDSDETAINIGYYDDHDTEKTKQKGCVIS